ncbi:MAG: NAD(P)H-hydrate dehydratase [Acidimicrobiia bacterium]
MQPVITPAESARLDAGAAELVPVLMERAGLGVAIAASEMGAGYGSRVMVLCGPGNNGGDGFVAARHLRSRGCAVSIRTVGTPRAGSAAEGAGRAAAAHGIPSTELGVPEPCDFVVDALFGVGFRGVLPEAARPWLAPGPPVLAVDVPSGLDALSGEAQGPVFRAARTVTFHALKPGHLIGAGPDLCGVVSVCDIGLVGGEPELKLCEEGDAPRPVRDRVAHKWSAGSVLVVGGSPGITGAPVLAARSALEMGAGAVAVACPAGVSPVVAASGPGIMTRPIGSGDRFDVEDAAAVLERAARFDVVVLGPGLGVGQRPFVTTLLNALPGPVVLDADAITSLPGIDELAARSGPTVVTPHAGEFRSVIGAEPSYVAASELPDRAGVVVLLKGNPTFIVGADRWVVTSGGRELATIGTGDVLAGMTAAFWARGLDGEIAARSAAYWHGTAAAALAARGTVTAERLAATIGEYAW